MDDTHPAETQVTSVERLDLQRYLGRWFEIGRLPLRFEDLHARNITAQYSLRDDGTVRVDNRCLDDNGKPSQAIGRAVPDDGHEGRLRVSFLPPSLRWIPFARANYWVLKIDDDYRYALVGTPDHKYLWLLSRTATVPPEIEAEYLEAAREQGFDLSEWIRPEQSGETVDDSDL